MQLNAASHIKSTGKNLFGIIINLYKITVLSYYAFKNGDLKNSYFLFRLNIITLYNQFCNSIYKVF